MDADEEPQGGGLVSRYFRTRPAHGPDQIEGRLWNDEAGIKESYSTDEKYQAAVLEQYKLCVEMADRISARRALANTFFLTLHSAILTLVGVFWKDRPQTSGWVLVLPLTVALGLCVAWFWLVRSYRQLNSGKYAVIAALERRLPASPLWRGEWFALGEGRDPSRYVPFTHLEQWVPALFAAAYVIGAGLAIASSL
jgi:hypothetical protein